MTVPHPTTRQISQLGESSQTVSERFSRLLRSAIRSPLVLVLVIVAFLLFVLPAVMIVLSAFSTAAPGEATAWSADRFLTVLSSVQTYSALGSSLLLALGAGTVGLVIAVGFAWLAVRSDAPLRHIITPAMVVVFASPQLFYVMSWVLLGQAPAGGLNRILQLVSGDPDLAPFDIVSWPGMIFVLSLRIAAIAYILLIGPFSAMNSSLEEAARMSGASRMRAFFQIELPALAPAILSAVVLSAVFAMGMLDLPLLLGFPEGIHVLSTRIYSAINAEFPANYAGASTFAMFIMLAVALIVILQALVLRGRSFVTLGGKSHRRDRIRLTRGGRVISAAAIGLFVIIAVVLPFGQLLLGSVQPFIGVYENLGLQNYERVLSNPKVGAAFGRTLVISIGAGFIATGLATLISIAAKRSRSALRSVPQAMTVVLLTLPGVTVGLGLLAVLLALPPLYPLYGTVVLAVIALAVAMTPIANRLTSAAIAQVGPEMEEAARMSGASPARAVVGILIRLVLPSFFASWFITAIIVSGNLDIPALVSAPGNEPLTLVALQLIQSGSFTQAAAVACLFLFAVAMIGIIALVIMQSLVARRRRDEAQIIAHPVEEDR